MTQSGPVFGFSLRDTLTRLIPGFALLLPILVPALVFYPDSVPDTMPFYVGVALVAYLSGEFIDQLRLGLFRVPMNFRYFLYRETNDLRNMPTWWVKVFEVQTYLPNWLRIYHERAEEDRLVSDLDLNFRDDMESELGIGFEENRPREIYDLLLIYMEPHVSSRLRRLQSISEFSANLRLAVLIGALIYTLYALSNWGDLFFFMSLLLSLTSVAFLFGFWWLLTLAHAQYDELLLKEYYLKRLHD